LLTLLRLCAFDFCIWTAVLENGRAMPEPEGGQVIKWVPQTPTFKFGNVPALFKAPAGKAKAFSVDVEVLYATARPATRTSSSRTCILTASLFSIDGA